ncbi:hypothetical protein [Streptomyces turgidiscabies]|uniref:Uncharacterized protein n=1 Tax=Streptomyces turgidiscabies TaxID=85558 RepID=A0ABU0RP64_9ACTN|nr:hypothetical protein [Streptomyces turgidiscabies]MDQ0933791.1 hypothetical protein [Streptomyces turgidiscabies]
MTDTTRTVVLKPGDTLLIGNLGQTSEDALDALHEGATRLRSALRLADVLLFEADIDTAAVSPVTPLPDAVVLRVFDRNAVAAHRETLAAWLKTNDIDPDQVADDWLSVEQSDGLRLIRYAAYRLTEDGRRLLDPRDGNRAWTVERVSPLVVDLDLPADT